MPVETVSLQIDSEAATAFRTSSAQEKRKFAALWSALVKEFAKADAQSLKSVMDELGHNAAERGLTPEILESILAED